MLLRHKEHQKEHSVSLRYTPTPTHTHTPPHTHTHPPTHTHTHTHTHTYVSRFRILPGHVRSTFNLVRVKITWFVKDKKRLSLVHSSTLDNNLNLAEASSSRLFYSSWRSQNQLLSLLFYALCTWTDAVCLDGNPDKTLYGGARLVSHS